MIKKILPLSIVVLVFVLGILFFIQSVLRKNNITTGIIQPTLYQVSTKTNTRNSTSSASDAVKNTAEITNITEEQFQNKLPIQTVDFTINHSERLNKYVVTLESDTAEAAYNSWLQQNPSYTSILQDQSTIITTQTMKELHSALDYGKKNAVSPEVKAQQDAKVFSQAINTLMNLPLIFMQSFNAGESTSVNPTLAPTPIKQSKAITPTTFPKQFPGRLVYYPQCNGPYDTVSLPEGCNVCDAGCGPTSVAMILSSYIDPSLTPPKVISLMSTKGVQMGCFGSYISDIYDYLKSRGDLKVSSYILSGDNAQADQIAQDFRGYTNAGWSIFVLANFKTDGGGHYFWVTGVTDNNQIMAYDPYYGKERPAPITENQYSPAPYYRYAFAVKKI